MKTIRKPTQLLAVFALMGGIAIVTAGCIPPPPGTYGSFSFSAPLPPPPPPIHLPPTPTIAYAPTIDVYYVQHVSTPVFYHSGYFYTEYHDHWYCTNRPGGSWAAVSPGFVPHSIRGGLPNNWRPSQPSRVREVRSFAAPVPSSVKIDTRTRSSSRSGQPDVSAPTRSRSSSRPDQAGPGRVIQSRPGSRPDQPSARSSSRGRPNIGRAPSRSEPARPPSARNAAPGQVKQRGAPEVNPGRSSRSAPDRPARPQNAPSRGDTSARGRSLR